MALFNFFSNKESIDKESTDKDSTNIENANKIDVDTSQSVSDELSVSPSSAVEPAQTSTSLLARMRAGLARTRSQFGSGIENLFLGAKQIDDDLFEELETLLLMADVGVDATSDILQRLTTAVSRNSLQDPQALQGALRQILVDMLAPCAHPLAIPSANGPFVILMVGVNGAGKTTTIGKLSKQLQAQGKSVMLAAGDTFRAAAVEQLQTWGERHAVPVVAQHTGADSASVIFDAVQSAQAKGIDVLIADTAGRLQNNSNLMEELSKVVRVMKKLDQQAPHEVMLVLDAGTGQNALNQVTQFNNTVGVTGLTLTKLDGTAKGGIVFALAQQSQLPIRFIGVGEKAEDLRPFNAEQFIDSLFEKSAEIKQ